MNRVKPFGNTELVKTVLNFILCILHDTMGPKWHGPNRVTVAVVSSCRFLIRRVMAHTHTNSEKCEPTLPSQPLGRSSGNSRRAPIAVCLTGCSEFFLDV